MYKTVDAKDNIILTYTCYKESDIFSHICDQIQESMML